MSYCCRKCGEPTTEVRQTSSFADVIVRKRYCLTCGQIHETAEVPIEISKVWLNAAGIILEYKAKDAAKSA